MKALDIVHQALTHFVKTGDTCIDATAGRGYDTSFLCDLVGNEGKVVAFDIQQSALDSTANLLASKGQRADLILDSHANLSSYFSAESVSAIVFNLGYLPHGDHSIYTHFDSTKKAITDGLKLLKHGGIMCASIYYGGDSGYEERDALLPWLATIDSTDYQVLQIRFHNWDNDPPIPVIILKN